MQLKQRTIEDMLEKLKIINKLYDVARIVDPIENIVVEYQNNTTISKGSICYNFWKRDTLCENCISRKAIEKNDTFAKIEYKDDTVYMVLAVPIELNEKKVSLELLKNITEERILFDSVDNSKNKAYSLLHNRKDNFIKDYVTKIYNNRYINERLPYDIMTRHMEGEYLSLLMINIDDFKTINSKYGYDFGNQILREFADIVQAEIHKEGQWIARYTDNTFLVILNNYSSKQAKEFAESLRKTIEEHKFYSHKAPVLLTSSIGIYTEEKPNSTMKEFIEKTEVLLKYAKNQGKNCIKSSEGA